ncbi:hypothetical protein [Desulfobacula toluolica]|uniref:Conserved uncharacterized protein n=1 Tax=Desulfobacula toluolica (strain DSM 7467 / Tol2) TaxID=651182 RepID=K0NDX0_DESTT|nr:hypothetical protein [Desulfobacula toluolica]CCK79111.1 conserved uncharacterized protein [Desulfobacula toluolica Tol2]
MKIIYICLWCMACTLLISDHTLAHGVRGRISSQKALMVESEYDDGEAMGYADVEVYSPMETICFQSGRTDRNGRFVFFPDKKGDWKVIVNDGMGHQLTLKTNVDENLVLIEQGSQAKSVENSRSFSGFQKIIMGLAFIFGTFGVVSLCKGKRN